MERLQAVDSCDHWGFVVEYSLDEVAELHLEGFPVFYEGLVDSFVVLDAYLLVYVFDVYEALCPCYY